MASLRFGCVSFGVAVPRISKPVRSAPDRFFAFIALLFSIVRSFEASRRDTQTLAGGKQSATTGFSGTKRVDPGGIAESLLPGDETHL